MERDEILMGRVKVGRTPAYQVADQSWNLKMVSFINGKGVILSGSYSQLHIASATDTYLNLEFTRHNVIVKGAFLAKISRAIADHRLVYVRESRGDPSARITAPIIEKILFHRKDGGGGESFPNTETLITLDKEVDMF